MYKIAVRASRDEVRQAVVDVTESLDDVHDVIETYRQGISKLRGEVQSRRGAGLPSLQPDESDADRQSLTLRLERISELSESTFKNFQEGLGAALPRMRRSWEHFSESFLSYYSEATLDTDEERSEALASRASLLEIQAALNGMISEYVPDTALWQGGEDPDSTDQLREMTARTNQMLNEEFSLILSSLIRMINILDVRLEDSSQHVGTQQP